MNPLFAAIDKVMDGVEARIAARAVHVEHICPPIPTRSHDYRATLDGYEPGDAMGYGPTAEAAVADLNEQLGLENRET